MMITIQWLNLGINAVVWVCYFLAVWGIAELVKEEVHLLLAGLGTLFGFFIGSIVGLFWPIARLCVS